MKRALVLAGGGARGAYQAGMLRELVVNQGIDFQIIRGVSVGALNAAFLAQAPASGGVKELKKRVRSLEKLWNGITGNHCVYAERGGFAAIVAGADSLYSLEPLRQLIRKNISVSALRKSGRDFAVGTVSLVSGHYREWTPKHEKFFEKLIASASIPGIFPYVDLKSSLDVLVDGGVRNITPLSSAFASEPDEIYVLLASRLVRQGSDLPDSGVQEQSYKQWDDNWLGTKVSGIDVLKRTIDILTDEIYLDDIRGALKWNAVAEKVNALRNAVEGMQLPRTIGTKIKDMEGTMKELRKRHVPVNVIAPREWFGQDNRSTEFSPALIKQAMGHGQEIAADRRLWLWPPV